MNTWRFGAIGNKSLNLLEQGVGRTRPQQDRAQQTYDRLLDAAGFLLAEVGVDNISTNMICARAGMTPPALYRYFKDKYAVIEALAERLMQRQSVVVERWLCTHAPDGIEALAANVEPLLRDLAAVTGGQPGALWVLRAIRAIPRLTHVRLGSHQRVADRLSEVYASLMPGVPAAMIWTRARLSVEYSYATNEMIAESDGADLAAIFFEAGRMLGSLFWFNEHDRAFSQVVSGKRSIASKSDSSD